MSGVRGCQGLRDAKNCEDRAVSGVEPPVLGAPKRAEDQNTQYLMQMLLVSV